MKEIDLGEAASRKSGIFPRGAGARNDQAPSFSGGLPGSQGFFPGGVQYLEDLTSEA